MKTRFLLLSVFVLFFLNSEAQNYSNLGGKNSGDRVITTAVPFLMIGPDGRAGGMGDGHLSGCQFHVLEFCKICLYQRP